MKWIIGGIVLLVFLAGAARAEEDELEVDTVEADLGSSREGSRTDSEVVNREEEAIK